MTGRTESFQPGERTSPFTAGDHLSGRSVRVGTVSMLVHRRTVACVAGLVVATVLAAMVTLAQGRTAASPLDVVRAVVDADSPLNGVLWTIRMPRVLVGLATGAALAVAGAVSQSLSRNPLGSPDIIGFTTGAATGAVISIVTFQAGTLAVAVAAVCSGLIVSALVFGLSLHRRVMRPGRLVLMGVGVNALLHSVNGVLLTQIDANLAIAGRIWLTGTLNARSWPQAGVAVVGAVVGLPALFAMTRRLNLMEAGEEFARQAGVATNRTRVLALGLAVCLVGVATATTGPIAFVALAAPHLARRLTGSAVVPVFSAGLLGATLMLAADVAGQHLPANLQAPVGTTTAVAGGLYLLWMLQSDRR